MKLRHLYPLLSTLALASAAIGMSGQAQAASYDFRQGGFADGAVVSGHFSGVDLDGDGYLYGYELTDFELFFSGNRAVGAFHHTRENLNGIIYALGVYRFDGGADTVEHLASSSPEQAPYNSYDAFGWPEYGIPGRVIDNLNGTSSITWEPMTVTAAVPEPESWALMLAGLGAVGLLLRRRKA